MNLDSLTYPLCEAIHRQLLLTPNQYTAINLVVLTPLIYLLIGRRGPLVRPLVLFLAIVRTLLDIIDGYVARRDGLGSKRGAQFDVATDTLFTVAVAVAVPADAPVLLKAALWTVVAVIGTQLRDELVAGDSRGMLPAETWIAMNSILLTPLYVYGTHWFLTRAPAS